MSTCTAVLDLPAHETSSTRHLPSPESVLADVVRGVRATDARVLRRGPDGCFRNVGGSGAGAVLDCAAVDPFAEPALLAGLARGTVVRWNTEDPERVLGPWTAVSAALIVLDVDTAVLLTSERRRLSESDGALKAAAVAAYALI